MPHLKTLTLDLQNNTQMNLPIKSQSDSDSDAGTAVGLSPRSRTKSKKPSMYKVIILNDDYTPMDFVIHVLQKFFAKDFNDATKVMLEVHQRGAGIAGVYTFEVAETKVYQVNQYSQNKQHPLKCVVEKA